MKKLTRKSFVAGLSSAFLLKAEAAAPSARASGDVRRAPLRIAHCGDPQPGLCSQRAEFCRLAAARPVNYAADMKRLEREIAMLNEIKPDLVYFAGDMMDDPEDIPKVWPRLLKTIKSPVIVTPGNHDVGPHLTAENEDRFIDVFGYSYKTIVVKGWRFIATNTQYWMPTNETVRRERYRDWLKNVFAEAKASPEPVIVAGHIPPFAHHLDEKDAYENCPRAERQRFLDDCIKAGARLYLSGHTHTLGVHGYKGLEILTAETTCCNFDRRPTGFRMLELQANGSYSWTFNEVRV